MPRSRSQSDPGSAGKIPFLGGILSSPRKAAVLWIGAVFLIAAGILVWNSPFVRDLFAGPKIPLPRGIGELSLGAPQDQIFQKYPEIKKALRPFNDDPLFKIATVKPKPAAVPGASAVDLLFFQDKLYYVSAMWEGDPAKSVPAAQWVENFRRWSPRRTSPTDVQSMGDQVLLKEWRYADGPTEMTLRDLNYPDHVQRWQDLRDASNEAAQNAFAKYRLETGS